MRITDEELLAQREQARAIAVALEQASARVAELHRPHFWRIGRTGDEDELVDGISDGRKWSTRTNCIHCRDAWPCPTMQALDPEADR